MDPLFGDNGPFWSRRYHFAEEVHAPELCAELEGVLAVYGVARMVVGHTPQYRTNLARENCGGRLMLTDVAMSRWMLNRPSDISKPSAVIYSLGKDKHGDTVLLSIDALSLNVGPRVRSFYKVKNLDRDL
jgi:hypothetical protein